MNIVLLSENWPPRIGGIERYLTNMMAHLPNASVQVVAPRGSEDIAADNVHVIKTRFFWPIIRPAWAMLLILLYVLHKKQNIDVIVCGKALFEGLAAQFMKKWFGIPYVICTYAMEIETWINHPKEKIKLLNVLHDADRIVYINDRTKRRLEELDVASHKLIQVYPGVEDRFFGDHTNLEVLQKYNIEKPYLLTVARLVARKGIDDLIRAMAILRDTDISVPKLIIAGDGPEKDRLTQLIEELHLQDTVRLILHVEDEELPALYAQASIFILTPKEIAGDVEGFGIVYLEAAATGTPTIGTRSGGVPEAVLDTVTGLLVPENSPSEIAKGIDRLLKDPTLAHSLAQAAKARAHRDFLWSVRGQQFAEVLKELVK